MPGEIRLFCGETLFEAGAPSETLYIVATGCLRAEFPDGRVAGDIARLTPLGEIGLLTGDVRSARVHALRTSLLYAFSRQAYYALPWPNPPPSWRSPGASWDACARPITRSSGARRAEVHDQCLVANWLAASMCIPGLALPVAFEDSLLYDGAMVNSLPTDVMQDLARDLIVASDMSTENAISAPGTQGPDPDFDALHRRSPKGVKINLMDVLFRTTSLTSESRTGLRTAQAGLYLLMPVENIKTFD